MILHRSGLYGTYWIGPWWPVLLVGVLAIVTALIGLKPPHDQAYNRPQIILLMAIECVLCIASILILVWNY